MPPSEDSAEPRGRNAPMKQVQRIVNPLLKAPGFEEKAMFLDDTVDASEIPNKHHLKMYKTLVNSDR